MAKELSLVLIKPDGVELSLTGEIISHLEREDLFLAGAKAIKVTREMAKNHYYEHRNKFFYESAIEYLMGKYHNFQWVYAFVYYGENACDKIRKIVGNTNPMERNEGKKIVTLRQKYGRNVVIRDSRGNEKIVDGHVLIRFENVVHASESIHSEYEVKLWFSPDEILEPFRLYDYKEIILKDNSGNKYKKLIWTKTTYELQKELF